MHTFPMCGQTASVVLKRVNGSLGVGHKQKLLAPTDVRFYGREWQFLETKLGLASTISSVTGINEKALECGPWREHEFSVAQKMSWASSRQTSRLEDRA